jgi:polysaccharide biosynthesis/export protein
MKIKSLAQHLAHWPVTFSLIAAACFIFLTGCETSSPNFKDITPVAARGSDDIILKDGDVLKITFPGADKMNTTANIRPDGKITLPIIGEVTVAGKTPANVQKELVELYSKQLVSSQDIIVSVQSASFPIYVNGAVHNPGKITVNRQLPVLDAIMEAGGPDYDSANLKSVKVIRTENGKTRNYTVNLKGLLNGNSVDVFYVQPFDIIYVPTKITWF